MAFGTTSKQAVGSSSQVRQPSHILISLQISNSTLLKVPPFAWCYSPSFYILIGSFSPLSFFLTFHPAPSLRSSLFPIPLHHQQTTLRTLDTARVGSTSFLLPTTLSSSLLSVRPSSTESSIPSRNTLAYAQRESSLVSENKDMLSFTSDFSVHGACGSCHISRRGGTTVKTSGLVRLLSVVLATRISHIPPSTWNRRLPSLADDS